MNNIDIDDNSQNIKIKSPKINEKNNNENKNQDAYPIFKNKIKQFLMNLQMKKDKT